MKTALEDLPLLKISYFSRKGLFKVAKSEGDISFGSEKSSCVASFRINVGTRLMSLDTWTGKGWVRTNLTLIPWSTNLGRGTMWFFQCPVTRLKCRNLYCVHGRWVSKSAIVAPRYKVQLMGRTARMLARYHRYLKGASRPYGKMTYRGALTPYGKRVERAERLTWELDDQVTAWLVGKFPLPGEKL